MPPDRRRTDTFEEISTSHIQNVNAACGLGAGLHVLELGCGIGRDAIPLSDVLGPDGRYIGIDVIADSIEWCAENISRRHPNFTFVHQDVQDDLHNPRVSSIYVLFACRSAIGGLT